MTLSNPQIQSQAFIKIISLYSNIHILVYEIALQVPYNSALMQGHLSIVQQMFSMERTAACH